MLLNIRKRVILQSRDCKSLIPMCIQMATGNFLLGYGRKSIGDVTFYRSGGQQRARARNRNPKNPKSAKQAVQRMVLASASKAIASLRSLYDHSAEGVSVGQESIRYWQSIITRGFRAAAASGIESGAYGTASVMAIKGAPVVSVYDKMPMSHGRLSLGEISVDSGNLFLHGSSDVPGTINSQESYVAELKKFGLAPGDQLTVVYIGYDEEIPVATFDGNSNYASIARYARVTFVSELPANFTGLLIDDGAFNAALIAESEGAWPSMEWNNADDYITINMDSVLVEGPAEYTLYAATLVRSQKQSDGKYYYNNAEFVFDENVTSNNTEAVYPSYQEGGTEIVVGEQLYLQNALLRASSERKPTPTPTPDITLDTELPVTLTSDAVTIVVTNNKEDWSDDNIEDVIVMTDSLGNFIPQKQGENSWYWVNGENEFGTGSASGRELTIRLGGEATYDGVQVTKIVLI